MKNADNVVHLLKQKGFEQISSNLMMRDMSYHRRFRKIVCHHYWIVNVIRTADQKTKVNVYKIV